MSTGAIIGIIIAVVVVVAILMLGSVQLRRARMRRQFGPEYDRLAKEVGPRKAAEELTARQRRVEALGIHPLTAEQQGRYGGDWAAVQERFVDTPAEAVTAASTLIWDVMRDRGYPADDRDTSVEALSVYHAHSLPGYREAQNVQTDSATTEELREAMIRYRTLFEDLLGAPDGQGPALRARLANGTEADDEPPAAAAAPDGQITADDTDRTADTPR